jgi:hypothetical protein
MPNRLTRYKRMCARDHSKYIDHQVGVGKQIASRSMLQGLWLLNIFKVLPQVTNALLIVDFASTF